MFSLPNEILISIFSHLDIKSYLSTLKIAGNFNPRIKWCLLNNFTVKEIKKNTDPELAKKIIDHYISSNEVVKITEDILDKLFVIIGEDSGYYYKILEKNVIIDNTCIIKNLIAKKICDPYFLLNLAAKYNALKTIKFLIEDLKLDLVSQGDYPIKLSISQGFCDMNMYLYSIYIKNNFDLNFKSLIKCCIKYNNKKTIQYILNTNSDKNLINAVIIDSVVYGNKDILDHFINNKIQDNIIIKSIKIACCSGNKVILEKLLSTFDSEIYSKFKIVFEESLYMHNHYKLLEILCKYC